MKKLLILGLLILWSFWGIGQATVIPHYRVPNSTAQFGTTIQVGSEITDLNDGKIYSVTSSLTSSQTLAWAISHAMVFEITTDKEDTSIGWTLTEEKQESITDTVVTNLHYTNSLYLPSNPEFYNEDDNTNLGLAMAASNIVRLSKSYDSDDKSLTIDSDIILDFSYGGDLLDYHHGIVGSHTTIYNPDDHPILNPNVTLTGTWDCIVKPEWFGAKGDGSENCMDEINASFDLARLTPQKTIENKPNAVYNLEGANYLDIHDVIWRGNFSTIHIDSVLTDTYRHILDLTGTGHISDSCKLDSTAYAGNDWVVSHDFITEQSPKTGDVVYLISNEYYNPGAKELTSTFMYGEFLEISKVKDNIIWFTSFLKNTYKKSKKAMLCKPTWVTTKIYDLSIVKDTMIVSYAPYDNLGLYCEYGKNVVLDNVHLKNIGTTGLEFINCYDVKVNNFSVQNSGSSGNGYGIYVGGPSCKVTFQNGWVEASKHATDMGGFNWGLPEDVLYDNIYITVTNIPEGTAAVNSHVAGSVKYRNVTVYNGTKYNAGSTTYDWNVAFDYPAGDTVIYNNEQFVSAYNPALGLVPGTEGYYWRWIPTAYNVAAFRFATCARDVEIENCRAVNFDRMLYCNVLNEDSIYYNSIKIHNFSGERCQSGVYFAPISEWATIKSLDIDGLSLINPYFFVGYGLIGTSNKMTIEKQRYDNLYGVNTIGVNFNHKSQPIVVNNIHFEYTTTERVGGSTCLVSASNEADSLIVNNASIVGHNIALTGGTAKYVVFNNIYADVLSYACIFTDTLYLLKLNGQITFGSADYYGNTVLYNVTKGVRDLDYDLKLYNENANPNIRLALNTGKIITNYYSHNTVSNRTFSFEVNPTNEYISRSFGTGIISGNVATTGDVTVTGNDLTFGNGEGIDNNTNGTIDINGNATVSGTSYFTGDVISDINIIKYETLGDECITNGTFANGDNWTFKNRCRYLSGMAQWDVLVTPDAGNCFSQGNRILGETDSMAVEVKANTYYKLVFKVRNQLAYRGTIKIGTELLASEINIPFPLTDTLAGAGITLTYYVLTSSNPTSLIFKYVRTSGDYIWIDNISLKEVTGGDLSINGKVTGYGGTNGIRIDASGNATIDGYLKAPVLTSTVSDTSSGTYPVGSIFMRITGADTSMWVKIRMTGTLSARWKKLTP